MSAIHYNFVHAKHSLVKNGEKVSTLLPHTIGTWSDLADPTEGIQTRVFSSTCLIVCNSGAPCQNCGRLKTVEGQRKARRDSRGAVYPASNKRFLTREELLDQLKKEQTRRRNAETREQYWRDKFNSEALEIDEEDQEDLVSMFKTCESKSVPEGMQCLWEQQNQLLHTAQQEWILVASKVSASNMVHSCTTENMP